MTLNVKRLDGIDMVELPEILAHRNAGHCTTVGRHKEGSSD